MRTEETWRIVGFNAVYDDIKRRAQEAGSYRALSRSLKLHGNAIGRWMESHGICGSGRATPVTQPVKTDKVLTSLGYRVRWHVAKRKYILEQLVSRKETTK